MSDPIPFWKMAQHKLTVDTRNDSGKASSDQKADDLTAIHDGGAMKSLLENSKKYASSHPESSYGGVASIGSLINISSSSSSADSKSWTANKTYALGDIVLIDGYACNCTVGGTSGSSEPHMHDQIATFSKTGNITDGGVVWKPLDTNKIVTDHPDWF